MRCLALYSPFGTTSEYSCWVNLDNLYSSWSGGTWKIWSETYPILFIYIDPSCMVVHLTIIDIFGSRWKVSEAVHCFICCCDLPYWVTIGISSIICYNICLMFEIVYLYIRIYICIYLFVQQIYIYICNIVVYVCKYGYHHVWSQNWLWQKWMRTSYSCISYSQIKLFVTTGEWNIRGHFNLWRRVALAEYLNSRFYLLRDGYIYIYIYIYINIHAMHHDQCELIFKSL